MKNPRSTFIHTLLLCASLLAGAYFRFSGLLWGDEQYQHPDERFLIWVTADIQQVQSPWEYFDTRHSTLNPANRGHGFFVYGTFPLFVTRFVVDSAFENPGWDEILQVGRGLSAACDLLTVLLVYLIAARLFGRWTGLLAGALDAASVLQIQQAHFYTVDSFATTFTTLAVYLAVRIASQDSYSARNSYSALVESRSEPEQAGPLSGFSAMLSSLQVEGPVLRLSLLFGLAVGMAMACKINTAPVSVLLPVALGLRLLHLPPEARGQRLARLAGCLVAGGLAAFVVFRILQPYAFAGPSFLNILPDKDWMQSIRDQRAQAAGDVDFPPALQWARRSQLFSFQNLTVWGLGLPLGILAWVSFAAAGWLLLRSAFNRVRQGGLRALWDSAWPAANKNALTLVWG